MRHCLAAIGWGLTVLAVAACQPDVRLQLPHTPPNHVVEGMARVPAGRPASFGGMVVCLSSPGRATITSVVPVDPVGGLRVQALAVRPNSPEQLGSDRKTLAALGFGHSHVVDVACSVRAGAGYELALQLVKPTSAPASAAGWLIHYRSGGQAGTVTWPLGVVVCSERDPDAPACRRLERRVMGQLQTN